MKHLFSLALLTALAAPLSAQNLLPENPHQFGRSNAEVKENSLQINVLPDKWNAVTKTLPLKQGYYRISFEHNAPAGVKMTLNTTPQNQKEYGRYYPDNRPDGTWRIMTGYLYLPEDGPGRINITAEGKTPAAVTVRGIRMEAFRPVADFKIATDEKSVPFWAAQWNFRNTDCKFEYVGSDDHIDGGKTLRFSPENGEKASVQSFHFPVQTGKTYQISLWLKASAAIPANISIDGWVTGKGAHWYRLEKVRLGTEWQEYSIRFTAPEEKIYRGMMCLKIEMGAPAKYIDIKQAELKEVK